MSEPIRTTGGIFSAIKETPHRECSLPRELSRGQAERDRRFLEGLFRGIKRSRFYRVNSDGEMEAIKLGKKL